MHTSVELKKLFYYQHWLDGMKGCCIIRDGCQRQEVHTSKPSCQNHSWKHLSWGTKRHCSKTHLNINSVLLLKRAETTTFGSSLLKMHFLTRLYMQLIYFFFWLISSGKGFILVMNNKIGAHLQTRKGTFRFLWPKVAVMCRGKVTVVVCLHWKLLFTTRDVNSISFREDLGREAVGNCGDQQNSVTKS